MATLSVDLRERILKAYDQGKGTREEVAERFSVSLGMVKKLLLQRRRTGCIKPRHHFSGSKKQILASHRMALRQHLKKKPDMTLQQMREVLQLDCTLQAIHYVLVDMGLTYKKDTAGFRTRPRRHPSSPTALEAPTKRLRALATGIPG